MGSGAGSWVLLGIWLWLVEGTDEAEAGSSLDTTLALPVPFRLSCHLFSLSLVTSLGHFPFIFSLLLPEHQFPI